LDFDDDDENDDIFSDDVFFSLGNFMEICSGRKAGTPSALTTPVSSPPPSPESVRPAVFFFRVSNV
jgi:hypothetical protein